MWWRAVTMPVAPACRTWSSGIRSSGPNQRQLCSMMFALPVAPDPGLGGRRWKGCSVTRNTCGGFMAEKEERVALVTGTTGIGRATTLRLARDGVRVMALGIDASGNAALAATALAERLQVETRLTDVSQPEEVATAVAETDRLFGGLDIIVNAAAVHPFGDVVETDPET